MNSLLQMLPPELQSTPALVAGFLALLGLILCTAGIKVARPLAAALVGGALAMLAATIMPASMSIDPWTSAIIGLALGLLIGALAFRMMQGVVLALGLSVLAAGAFYEWQVTHNPLPAAKAAVLHLAPNFPAGKVYAALPMHVQTTLQIGFALGSDSRNATGVDGRDRVGGGDSGGVCGVDCATADDVADIGGGGGGDAALWRFCSLLRVYRTMRGGYRRSRRRG